MENQKERLEKLKKKMETAKTIVEQLQEVAEIDGELTVEETRLINSIAMNVNEFYNLVEAAMADNTITDEELEEIHVYEKRIIQEASSEAFKDGKISPEERALLTKLIFIMETMEE
ncbi:MAG: hypothetical protein D6732_09320 [Methanobacteriota archaeon]|nr:MAG: hypothetical protein D6732_09320 [Euryarchaeota archaeon]